MSCSRINPENWVYWVPKTVWRSKSISVRWSDELLPQWVFATEIFIEKNNQSKTSKQINKNKTKTYKQAAKNPEQRQPARKKSSENVYNRKGRTVAEVFICKAFIWEMTQAYESSFILIHLGSRCMERKSASNPPKWITWAGIAAAFNWF